MPKTAALCLLLLCLCAPPAMAGQETAPAPTWKVKVDMWFSFGRHDYEVRDTTKPGRVSDLTYDGIRSNVVTLQVEKSFPCNWFARAALGFGAIYAGRLVNQDFNEDGGVNSDAQSLVSQDDLWFGTIDLGRVLTGNPKRGLQVRAYVGYQRWEERVTDGAVHKWTWEGQDVTSYADSTLAGITNKTVWDTMRLGLETSYRFANRVRLLLDLTVVPWAHLENIDTHHQRSDLAKSPSFRDWGEGQGFNLGFELAIPLTKNLELSLGYRWWWLHISSMDGEVFLSDGTTEPISNDLSDFSSTRYGVTLGLVAWF